MRNYIYYISGMFYYKIKKVLDCQVKLRKTIIK